ncbi:MAG: hypothetical protein LKH04_01730 [Lachnospiraceae bacterium]|jgi:hypothetical protein|nr:hypothetical protein [Lachnospiraceae bacterium]MCI1397797.1 hypothetical protein [Lachnospiraceae bacterium]MCI1423011.1 hypothetical protein [Lachnospiraceae bacterium]MCI1451775.1 hypothetical protein [Lachnospiraceae bacterium]MDD5849943.1 hypothetical protein [Bacillota bacterium]
MEICLSKIQMKTAKDNDTGNPLEFLKEEETMADNPEVYSDLYRDGRSHQAVRQQMWKEESWKRPV